MKFAEMSQEVQIANLIPLRNMSNMPRSDLQAQAIASLQTDQCLTRSLE